MLKPRADRRVRNSARWFYLGSGLAFLAKVSLGILKVSSLETPSRGWPSPISMPRRWA